MNSKIKLLFFILITSLLTDSVLAANILISDVKIIQHDEIINDDLYIGSGHVEVKGTINGDLIVVGGDVNITGKINGDLTIVGKQIYFGGQVTDDVRIAGAKIRIDGDIQDDALVAGGHVEILKDANINGTILVFSNKFESYGTLNNNTKVSSGEAIIGGKIKGDLEINSRNIRITPTARIFGNLIYSSTEEAEIDTGAEIKGMIKFNNIEVSANQKRLLNFSVIVFGYVSTAIVGLLMIALFPRHIIIVIDSLKKSVLKTILIGLTFLLIVPPFLLLLFITIVGVPLALIGVALFAIALYLSKIFTSLWIFGLIARKKKYERVNLALGFLIGLLIITILVNLPYIGLPFEFLSLVLGYGALVNNILFGVKSHRK